MREEIFKTATLLKEIVIELLLGTYLKKTLNSKQEHL